MMSRKITDVFGKLSEGARAYREARNSSLFEGNQKAPRTFTKQETLDYLQNPSHRTVDSYAQQLGIDPKRHDHSAWMLDINELYSLRNSFPSNVRKFNDKFERGDKKCQVIVIQNQKGGVGKTVTAVTTASGLATEYHEEYRIGLIDLDGQSTATMYYTQNTDDHLSIGDLITNSYELDDNETEVDAIKDAFQPTSIPNLRICPASQRDRGVDGWFHKQLAAGHLDSPYKQLERIIDAVREDFDVIIIDTPPSLSFITLNAYYSASAVIFPLGATENDMDATCGYFECINEVADILDSAGGHKGYDFVRVLITNYKEDTAYIQMANKIHKFFGEHVYSTEFKHSIAVRECSSYMCTLFDISKSEYPKTKSSFASAVTNAYSVVSKIHSDIVTVWESK
ncbi:chromosome partitioning protein ParA [Photobacterium kishitanii]|nr:chromosome partitioning protein ParA [Photobacterium kishitanii]KJG60547.1 chromosome partitioning protein ParA [Photobacterium kishitanii]KJG64849.1 chromosome partitioning protein ParA [Photobacterium kishitanii]KJG68485.1 chromosome partitioning protein ParA [Photobacterium kishitanii]